MKKAIIIIPAYNEEKNIVVLHEISQNLRRKEMLRNCASFPIQ